MGKHCRHSKGHHSKEFDGIVISVLIQYADRPELDSYWNVYRRMDKRSETDARIFAELLALAYHSPPNVTIQVLLDLYLKKRLKSNDESLKKMWLAGLRALDAKIGGPQAEQAYEATLRYLG